MKMIDSENLYSWVRDLPIVDWHNHLDMAMLAEDRPLGSLYEVWVKSDPYKHRAMRICGEPERIITGDASEGEKWAAWTRTLPKLVGNPLFAWAKMELEWLGIDGCDNITLSEWTPSKMLKRFGVEYLSPCVGVHESSALVQLGQRAARPLHDISRKAFGLLTADFANRPLSEVRCLLPHLKLTARMGNNREEKHDDRKNT